MTNPLLVPVVDAPFPDILPAHVEPAADVALARAEAALDAIRAVTTPTYESTLGAFERATEDLEWLQTVVDHLEAVATTPELRAAHEALQPRLSAFYARIPLDAALYRALSAFAETDEARALDPTRARLLTKRLDEFRRHGAACSDADKAKLLALDVELSEKTTKFSQNVLDATNAFELLVGDDRIAGLPQSAVEAARASAASKGKDGYRFTLHQPSLLPVLQYADDRALRETLWRASNTRASRAPHDNAPLLADILRLRAEKARILGFGNFADLVLADRMAKQGARALAFVEDLTARTEEAFARETAELEAFARAEGAPLPLAPWDVGYYSEKLRKARFDFDGEALRPYFAADAVLDGIFRLSEVLFGITVRARPAPVWDAEVRTFGIEEDGRLVATFYVDLHPRENKRGGAWMNPLRTGRRTSVFEPHVGLFCANATPPVDGKPALLTHDEVLTLLHEYGHLLHHALSQVEVRSLAGTNVAWDFVELPSQLMENFGWERATLDRFARHHETGAPIPDDLFERLVRARTFRAATMQMRQLSFAATDLALHTRYDAATDGDPVGFARRTMQPFAPTPFPDDYAMICSFTHLFAGAVAYASGYYSYKWAEVLDADCFTRFLREGVENPAVGRAYRDAILARGDGEAPEALFRRFMGRDPDVTALLAREGLLGG